MKCPYCGKQIQNASTYCDYCGNQIVEDNPVTDNAKQYWNSVNEAQSRHKERIDRDRAEKNRIIKQRKQKRNRNIAIIVAIAVAIFTFIFVVNQKNKNVLRTAHDSMIGETFSDGKENVLSPGDEVERVTVEILSQESLHYKRGEYELLLKGNSTKDYEIHYDELEIYEDSTRPYNLSISFWGRVTIEINDKKYSIELSEDYQVEKIQFYDSGIFG